MKKIAKIMCSFMLILMVALSATACGISNNYERVEEKLDDEGYTVYTLKGSSKIEAALNSLGMDADPDDIECVMTAEDGDEFIYLVFFEKTKAAKEFYEDFESDGEELLDYMDVNGEVGRDGKVVYMGTKRAIKDAK